jgi:hypothetical protein
MRSSSLPLALAAAVGALAMAAGSGSAAPAASPWSPITGSNNAGDQLGLARTADGTLHVIWNRGTGSASSIFDTRLSANGAKRGTTTVTGRWDGAKNGLALLVMPDGTLRLFASGGHSSPSSSGGVSTFTAPASGASWTLGPEVWGGPVAASAGIIGAALTKDGQVVTGWRGTAAEGVPPAAIPQNGYAPFQLGTRLATDAGSGAVVLAGTYGGGKGGVFVQQILPGTGKVVVLPDNSFNNDWISGVSGRIGAPGIYVAYADTKAARLYRYGGTSRTLARGPFTSATVCAGPDGRLWVAWGDSADQLFVTRSNRAAGAFEPVQKLTLPQQTTNGLRFLQCEGSAGPVDLFAQAVDKSNGVAFWHTHLLALLSVQAGATKTGVTISVRDAGDPVPGAVVAVGGKHLKSGASGQVSLALRPGSYSATAAAPGYGSATARFSVR